MIIPTIPALNVTQQPSNVTIDVGETFTVDIHLGDINEQYDTAAIELLTYNKNIIIVEKVESGTLFENWVVWIDGTINNTNGQLKGVVGATTDVVSQGGYFATITFKGVGDGVSHITIKELGVAFKGTDISGSPIIGTVNIGQVTVGDGNGAPTVALLAQAKRVLDENNVPTEDRTLIHSSYFLEDLLNITEVTSSDFNTVKALVMGDMNTYMGFKFIMIGGRTEGGLPFSDTNKRYNFAYHKQAVGLAIGKDMTTMVDWVAVKTAWQIGCVYSAGAIAIDTDGIVIIHTSEA